MFRFETFGNEGFWTRVLQLPRGMKAAGVTPLQALALGISVDIEKVPAAMVPVIAAELKTDLSPANAPARNSPATTEALIEANAVIGVSARNIKLPLNGTIDVNDTDVYAGESVGITCAFCHSISDGSIYKPAAGKRGGTIGKRLDGQTNHDLDVGKAEPHRPRISPHLPPIFEHECNRQAGSVVEPSARPRCAVWSRPMISKRVLCTSFATVVLAACFIDNPERASVTDAGAPDATLGDAPGDATTETAALADAGAPLCVKYGGYKTLEVVVGDLFGALVADCRISRFFTVLTAERQGHLYDCLVKQVAVVMGCPGVKYDVDNAGLDCRDMATSHKGLSIRGADFDALLQDLTTVLLKDGVAQTDIDRIAPRLLALRDDIVTNSAPSHGKSICDAGGQ